ncbi:MAG: hypothetical protein KDC90_00670 [Ignavibacteriae bacterium]|nr:hypothetical protein [Ignavibacteriota bacterium]
MYYRGPLKYKIYLAGDANNRKIIKKTASGKEVNFSSPETEKGLAKLYVLSIEKEIVYIGFTSQSITTRLYAGLRSSGENGYHGYKWKHEDELDLSVFVYQNLFGDDAELNNEQYKFVEALEAELVYLVRNKTGNWPRYQNEIHFHSEKTKTAKIRAEEIYNVLMK